MEKNQRKSFWVNLGILVLFCFFSIDVFANNVEVANVTIIQQSTAQQTCKIEFDISWENSWRNQLNYDAVWVFIKYSTDSGSTWAHATLKSSGTNPSEFSQGTGTTLDVFVPTDKKGAFLQRASNGVGSVDTDNLSFVWDWNADGLTASSSARVKVFAIEMVYIPQASFYLGDGASTRTFRQTGSNIPVQITTSSVVVKSDAASHDDSQLYGDGILVDGDGGIDKDGILAVDNATYPTGYNAFYLMKDELSQGAYVDFLNTITSTQATTRYPGTPAFPMGYTLSESGGVYSATASWVAMNHISWCDLAAYADWAGLRPITELEYEKACRGPATPVAGEYAWGNTNISTTTYTYQNSGTESESVSNQPTDTGNAIYGSTSGQSAVRRVGMLATSYTSRQEAGAGYYGVLDLTGNVWERAVTLGNSVGRGFQATHGDGAVTSDGYADNADWPGYESGKVGGISGGVVQGFGDRGEGYYYANYLAVSDRTSASYIITSTERSDKHGGRLGRSAS